MKLRAKFVTTRIYFSQTKRSEKQSVDQEILASDLRAFLDFRLQIEMMEDYSNECSFLRIEKQAKDLTETFKECLKVLKASSRRGKKP